MIVTGGCLCGAVRYRVIGPPRATSPCHFPQFDRFSLS